MPRVRYPPPRFPMLPVVGRTGAGTATEAEVPTDSAFFSDRNVIHCARGCDALLLILDQLGLRPGDRVLLPALHCPSLSRTLRMAGVEPLFHRVGENLLPDDADIEAGLAAGARALLLIHYFGFRQDAAAARRRIDAHGATLIEDCAHTLFGPAGNLPGTHGQFALASTRKLFPIPDGGAALSNVPGTRWGSLRPLGPMNELRFTLRAVQQAADASRLGALSAPVSAGLSLLDRVRGAASRSATAVDSGGRLHPVTSSPAGSKATPRVAHASRRGPRPMSRISSRIVRGTQVADLARIRRAHYVRLRDAVGAFAGCHALFPELPDDVVPYVFPLILQEPLRMFPALKQRGVPMYRWEEITGLGCAVTDRYAQQLVQLPCHQALATADVDWIVAQLRDVAG